MGSLSRMPTSASRSSRASTALRENADAGEQQWYARRIVIMNPRPCQTVARLGHLGKNDHQ